MFPFSAQFKMIQILESEYGCMIRRDDTYYVTCLFPSCRRRVSQCIDRPGKTCKTFSSIKRMSHSVLQRREKKWFTVYIFSVGVHFDYKDVADYFILYLRSFFLYSSWAHLLGSCILRVAFYSRAILQRHIRRTGYDICIWKTSPRWLEMSAMKQRMLFHWVHFFSERCIVAAIIKYIKCVLSSARRLQLTVIRNTFNLICVIRKRLLELLNFFPLWLNATRSNSFILRSVHFLGNLSV